jgi:putative ABC transport system substrate-binding protein
MGQGHCRRNGTLTLCGRRALIGAPAVKKPVVFYTLVLLVAALAWPCAVQAQATGQTRKMPRIGILSSLANDPEALVSRLSTSLRPLGWPSPTSVQVDVRVASGDFNRLSRFATQLVQLKPDVLLALWDSDVAALRAETRSIPIVMLFGVDPAGAGLVEKVEKLLRPSRNVTGVLVFSPEVASKELGLLKEAFPGAKRVGFVWNPAVTSSKYRRVAQRAADELNLTLVSVEVRKSTDFEQGMETLAAARIDSLFVDGLTLFSPEQRAGMIDFAARRHLPAIYVGSSLVDRGGLMSYNPSVPELWREGAGFVDAILRGKTPEDLPLREAPKFGLGINLKTAKALGLTIPPSLRRAAAYVSE